MKVLCTILVAASLAAGVVSAQPQAAVDGEAASGEGQTFITREWTWLTGTVRTTFTAHGPSEQVNQLDPQGHPLECQDCMLASSVQFELNDEFQPVSDR